MLKGKYILKRDVDYQDAFEVVQKLLNNTLKMNEKYYHALKFYADQEKWATREIVLLDQGAVAIEALKMEGKNHASL